MESSLGCVAPAANSGVVRARHRQRRSVEPGWRPPVLHVCHNWVFPPCLFTWTLPLASAVGTVHFLNILERLPGFAFAISLNLTLIDCQLGLYKRARNAT